MKAMLACDCNPDKLPDFPFGIQPKIDGVRGLNMYGELTGRSLKRHANKFTTNFYSRMTAKGFDGELAANLETHPDLCRLTSSALSTIEGEPYTLWWLFDYIVGNTMLADYETRYAALVKRVDELQHEDVELWNHVRVMPMIICENEEQFLYWEDRWLEEGYEGIIIRKLSGKHKQGRSTIREAGLLRKKRFIQSEAIITAITEGEINLNDPQINEMGRQFRSSHKDGKIPSGMVGNFTSIACETITDPSSGKVVITMGQTITIAPGNMSHDDRKLYFENPGLAIGKVAKYKFFPKGIKDKPRFATFQTFKAESDL